MLQIVCLEYKSFNVIAIIFLPLGKIPSPQIVNTNPVEIGHYVSPPAPVYQVTDTDVEAMSKTIARLRRDLEDEKKKNEILIGKNLKIKEENESLAKLVKQHKEKIEKLLSKKISAAEKKRIVQEVLKNSKFTEVWHFCFKYYLKLKSFISKSFRSRGLLLLTKANVTSRVGYKE